MRNHRGEQPPTLSTAPSQAHWLHPLDELVSPDTINQLAPRAVQLCRYGGELFCLPRLVDVRLMWVRSDRIADVPKTWNELLQSATKFGFPGRESGLFGTFFELVVGVGGRLFDEFDQPCIESPEATRSIELLCRLARRLPDDMHTWHYDDVDDALLGGQVDAAGAWPGASRRIARSPLAKILTPHQYPSGSKRHVSYAGCHAWAIPKTCADVSGAHELLTRLLSIETQSIDAAGGTICSHLGALAKVEPANDIDRRRLEITASTIASSMITYPPLPYFPEIEEAGWREINKAICGVQSPAQTASNIQTRANRIVGKQSS